MLLCLSSESNVLTASGTTKIDQQFLNTRQLITTVMNLLFYKFSHSSIIFQLTFLHDGPNVFANLFSLPRTGIRQDEGRSDKSPIILDGHSSVDFDCLLDHLFRRIQADTDELSPANTESVPFLISLLQMGAIFDIGVAKSHAIHHLKTHPDLELTMKLQLCHRFRIITWLSPTFKALVSQPIENLDPSSLGQLPTRILHALIQVKHRITTHRLTLAAVAPPAIGGFSCLTPVTCALEWESAWKEGPAEMLHHPDIFYAGRDILAKLVSADLSPICLECVEMSVFNVKDSGCLLMEEGFVEEMLGELTTWLINQ
ncbi:hypothetical protein DFJ58DRAFT_732736 [Suillus subalutaceus]|uniref:uncharacterized protein n=1 Tax=Suillus subalutaceus TaxID=48586 RepID=UPI001B87238D|nr:uncharacterized protein DFJ58DRAFT_732736 [Suillus subalutaceus]KAG1840844.1 hypothetical protein DFJ58DRAFT_732736 [Suillus subalutaceus]